MIARLRGTMAAASLGEVVIDVGGVGYLVNVPAGMSLPRVGEEVVLHTSLIVREDAMTLYGFTEPSARTLFETLLSVSGVGPRLALAALGTLGADGLRRAVVTEDLEALTVVPGVGKKSAQRIVLELGEKLGADTIVASGVSPNGHASPRDEVRQALAALGYAPAEIIAVVEGLSDDDTLGADELLREALRGLART